MGDNQLRLEIDNIPKLEQLKEKFPEEVKKEVIRIYSRLIARTAKAIAAKPDGRI